MSDVHMIKETNLKKIQTDSEVTSLYNENNLNALQESPFSLARYCIVGIIFGIVFIKAEIISWFRIQEMFRLQSFHMFGVIGTAVTVGMISIWCIKKFNIRTIKGEPIIFYPVKFNKGQVIGGLFFGFGWAMTGACPGPLFAQIGTGALVVIFVLFSAIAGTWVYGYFREKLPH